MIRQAAPEDAADIAAIWNPVIRETAITFTTEQKTEAALADAIAARGQLFLVAGDKGRVAGFATAFPFRNGPGYARTLEHTIHLDPRARGRGTGRALMAALAREAAAQGAASLWAGISSANPAGVAFHAAIGYAHVAVLPQVGWKLGRWHDLILMCKRLSPR